MVGQESIQKELFSQSLQYSRKTLLFIGESGCGKHTLVKELAKHFCLDLYDISETISSELINDILLRSTPAMYLIDLNMLTEKQQNIILKFIEEPDDNSFIVLISNNKYSVLDTVLNRCCVYEFGAYTKEELEQIVGFEVSNDILNITNTPGQIKLLQNNYHTLLQLCKTIVGKLSQANFSNTLSIASKINFDDEYDKFDLNIFLKVLLKELCDSFIIEKNNKSLELYTLVQNECKKLIDTRLNKKLFMENLLTNMWSTANDM